MRYSIVVLLAAACGSSTPTLVADAHPDAPPIPDAAPDAVLAGCASAVDCGPGEMCELAPQAACGRTGARGACVTIEGGLCPDLLYPVCGCDGAGYLNECFEHVNGVSTDYGGPCRAAGVFVACTTSADCQQNPPVDQYCVDDPRDACDPANGDTGCAGVCVHANQPCGDDSPCPSEGSHSEVLSPDTEACVTVIGDTTAGPGACVYTTRLTCASASDCGDGELCLPIFACDAGSICLGVCVRP